MRCRGTSMKLTYSFCIPSHISKALSRVLITNSATSAKGIGKRRGPAKDFPRPISPWFFLVSSAGQHRLSKNFYKVVFPEIRKFRGTPFRRPSVFRAGNRHSIVKRIKRAVVSQVPTSAICRHSTNSSDYPYQLWQPYRDCASAAVSS